MSCKINKPVTAVAEDVNSSKRGDAEYASDYAIICLGNGLPIVDHY